MRIVRWMTISSSKLPLVQREILFSLLKDRTIILGSSESERREAVVRGSETLPPGQSENRLMAAVATRDGYEQLLADLGIAGYVALRELSVFGVRYEKIYASLAEEVDSQGGSWLRIFSWYKR